MQLSAANLLIASQQSTKTAGPAPQAQAQFAQALAKETGTVAAPEGFAPMTFRQTTAPAQAASAPATPAQTYNQAQRPGAQLDIRI